jgi:hypothetical protein
MSPTASKLRWRARYYLVAEGVVSAAEVDTALSWGPGLRWGDHGQHGPQSPRWRPGRHRALLPAVHRPDDGLLEDPRLAGVLTPEVQKKLISSVHAEVGSRSIDDLAAERDEVLLGLLELRDKVAKSSDSRWSRTARLR